MQISIGSKISIHFALRLPDGVLVESSFDNEPLDFVVGDGSMDKGLELALIGLQAGDRQTLRLMPGQAFGTRDAAAIHVVERDLFPPDMQLEPGQIIGFSAEDGQEVACMVLEAGAEKVQVDFNHPLAGRELDFEVQVLAVENAT